MTHVELRSEEGAPPGTVRIGASMAVRVRYAAQRAVHPVLGVVVKTIYGAPVFCASDRFCDQLVFHDPAARATVVCTIEKVPLIPGTYMIDLWLGDAGGDFDVIFDAISFDVLAADVTGTGRLPSPVHGSVFCEATWQLFAE